MSDNRKIEELGDWSVLAWHVLQRAGIETVQQLTEKSESELMRLRGTSRRTIEETKKILAQNGLSLSD